jgi:hypothetical protein
VKIDRRRTEITFFGVPFLCAGELVLFSAVYVSSWDPWTSGGGSTTRKSTTVDAPFWATTGALEPAGATGPVVTGYCRRSVRCVGGSSVTTSAPTLLRRQ